MSELVLLVVFMGWKNVRAGFWNFVWWHITSLVISCWRGWCGGTMMWCWGGEAMGPIVWGFRYLQRKTTYTFSNLVLESLAEKRLNLWWLWVAASITLWLKCGFCISPITYGEIGLSANEFLAPGWQKALCLIPHCAAHFMFWQSLLYGHMILIIY